MTTYTVTKEQQEAMDRVLSKLFEIPKQTEFTEYSYSSDEIVCGWIGNKFSVGIVPSEETRQKIREAMIGRTFTDEWKAKIGAKHKGKIISEETKKKLSEAALKRPPASDELRRKRSENGKGRKQSPESIAKMLATRAANKLKKINQRSCIPPSHDSQSG